MKNLFFKTKRMSVQMQRLLMMMATILMAFTTLTACDILEDNNDENGKEEEGGNGGGGVSGKRIKKIEITCSKPIINEPVRSEYSYNSDGTPKRIDDYDASSKLFSYQLFTSNSDGTVAKWVVYSEVYPEMRIEQNWVYTSNKTVQKSKYDILNNGVIASTANILYTYENGKIIREDWTWDGQDRHDEWICNYDSKGKRTSTTYNLYIQGLSYSMTYTRTYNSDGTIQKVTYPKSVEDNTLVTATYTWENGKTTMNFDDFTSH